MFGKKNTNSNTDTNGNESARDMLYFGGDIEVRNGQRFLVARRNGIMVQVPCDKQGHYSADDIQIRDKYGLRNDNLTDDALEGASQSGKVSAVKDNRGIRIW